MKRVWLPVFIILFLGFLIHFAAGDPSVEAAKPEKKALVAKASCASCHSDFSSVLPKGHPPVQDKDITACTSCHEPDMTGKPQKSTYSARMHLAHLPPKGGLDCTACHSWIPRKSFGLIGVKGSWGAPSKDEMELMKKVFASWASSQYSDNRHAKAGIVCAGCHGKDLPKADDTVENSRCLTCHGPMDQLAKKIEPKDFKDRNPHKSHLGDIACTVCHKSHGESKVYCLGCHQNFKMKIQGAAKQ
jgi:nitrate/TMAO reductase-like tetraheme cytochrome c subunit